jgi:predicted metal-dependent phosphoesterase TrpH
VRADLHSHSAVSDGTSPPGEVISRARAAGVDVIALTDHDTVAGHAGAAAALARGQVLVPGMELSCRRDSRSVHMLGYLFDPADPGLLAECSRIRDGRVSRARAIVDRLGELGTGVTWDQVEAVAAGGVIGRPHIARAMAAAGVVESPEQAFGPEWLGPGGRAYVARYAPDPVRAIALIRGAGGVAVLAHPRSVARGWMLPDQVIAELAAAGLSGVEVHHPEQDGAQRRKLLALADGLGLVASGGSDDHGELTGHRIGCDTIAPDAYERLVEQATGGTPVTGD